MSRITLFSCMSNKLIRIFHLILILSVSFVFGFSTASAQDGAQVNEIHGTVEVGMSVVYLMPELREGETIYVYLEATSGNLDPMVGLFSTKQDPGTLIKNYKIDLLESLETGKDPLVSIPTIRNKYLLAWDDDSGEGYSAKLIFEIPEDGSYRLFVSSALSTLELDTSGDFRLLVGIDAPEVLTGEAEITEAGIIKLDKFATPERVCVQEVIGSITSEKSHHTFHLNNFEEGDILTVYVETTSGDLIPTLVLLDYGDKPIRSSNVIGSQSVAKLEYTFSENTQNYSLALVACCSDQLTSGSYRLLIGVNQPDVLSGQVVATGEPVLRQPIEVGVGIKLQQITDVDQKAENFGAVISLQMEWTDPALGYSPDSCDCKVKVYTDTKFDDFIDEVGGRWPEFTLSNQQGNRWVQNRIVVLEPDGHILYFERFTTQFQAPHFNFRKYPFDQQIFVIHVDSLYPEEYYVYHNLKEFTEIGSQLGEEEWIISDQNTSVTSQISNTQEPTARYSFRFNAKRVTDYYISRILLPIFLILIVSWITFFLHDIKKRIDVTSANLLLFIAFNFTVANDLPRLGYLTFLDMILLVTFIMSVIFIIYNVFLRRLEVVGKDELIHRIDRFAIWVYPIGYAFVFWLTSHLYLANNL